MLFKYYKLTFAHLDSIGVKTYQWSVTQIILIGTRKYFNFRLIKSTTPTIFNCEVELLTVKRNEFYCIEVTCNNITSFCLPNGYIICTNTN